MIAHKDVWEALFAIQGEVAELTKNADNPFYRSKYVPLPDLLKAVLPLCQKHGVLLMQIVVGDTVQTGFRHVASETAVADSYPVHCADKTNPQAFGTAVSYARRYGLKAGLAIIELDDDGNAASTRPGQSAPQNAQPARPTAAPRPVQGGGRPEAQGRAPAASEGKSGGHKPNLIREDDVDMIWTLARRLDQDSADKGETFRIVKDNRVGIFGKVATNVGVKPGRYSPAALPPQAAADLRSFYEFLCKKNDIPTGPEGDALFSGLDPEDEGGYGDALADDFDPTKG